MLPCGSPSTCAIFVHLGDHSIGVAQRSLRGLPSDQPGRQRLQQGVLLFRRQWRKRLEHGGSRRGSLEARLRRWTPDGARPTFRSFYDHGHAHGQQRLEWQGVPCPSTMAASISASQFKARCLGLMDQVAATGEVLVITKNGRPVAELHPCAAPRRPSPFGLHPEASIAGDVLAPIDTAWTALA